MELQYTEGLIPFTFFASIKDIRGTEPGYATWPELVEDFLDQSREPYKKKEDAPLFTSAVFEPRHRLKRNVKHAGMVVLDVDGSRNPEVATLGDVDAVFHEAGFAGLVYTTASHAPERHRFRILIPLLSVVSAETYTRAFWVMDTLFGSTADITKFGAESLFYLPGDYAGVPNELRVYQGDILSGDTWAEFSPEPVKKERPARKSQARAEVEVQVPRAQGGPEREADWSSLWSCPLVTSSMIDDYRYLRKSDNYHNGLYKFLVAVAGNADRRRYRLTADELERLARELDKFDGGYYPNRDLLREAENAIAFIASTGAR
jgi:hypothetical protein